MTARKRREKISGRFLAMPHTVLNSQAYLSLGPHARSLLFDMAVQYNGRNNGDLSATWEQMRQRGWKSRDTLCKAKKQLIERQLIVETRKGHRPNVASLYAVTWCGLDDCGGKLEMTEKAFPRSHYAMYGDAPPLVKTIATTGNKTTIR
jgi:hypothetical protein